MKGLKGKVAIVSGGATSIGAEVVRAFHNAGTRVVIADVKAEAGAKLAKELGSGVAFQHTDITQDDQIEHCASKTVELFGGVDFLINVACTYVDNGIEASRADWLTSYNVNVVGGVMFLKAVRPHMIKRGGGVVVNFGSISAKVAQTGRWLYPATKSAIHQVTRSEALDLAKDKIRVNTVSPGWTWCTLLDQISGHNKARVNQVASSFHMLGRMGEQEDVAQAVLFLCSDHAAFITGADLPVDGGYSAMGPEQAEPAIGKIAQ
ncbi:MAG: SDR family oxidoreductase [Acidobacteria bacterium]|nr:SDR family oxidoreductase [Acidobacteriota bacterium]